MKLLALILTCVAAVSAVIGITLYTSSQHRRQEVVSPTPTPIIETNIVEADVVVPIRLVFTGDVMLDRNIRVQAERVGYDALISDFSALFAAADLVIPNLEGPITSNASTSVGSF
jgi:hypothetical protein